MPAPPSDLRRLAVDGEPVRWEVKRVFVDPAHRRRGLAAEALRRVEQSARVLDALSRGARTAGAARRVELVSTGRRFLDDARECIARSVPQGTAMGVEGVSWLARLEACWASLRWVAATDAPDEDELLAAWRAAESTTDYEGNAVELARVRTDLAAILRATGHRTEAAAMAALARPTGEATGDRLVREGVTSREEVLRVTRD